MPATAHAAPTAKPTGFFHVSASTACGRGVGDPDLSSCHGTPTARLAGRLWRAYILTCAAPMPVWAPRGRAMEARSERMPISPACEVEGKEGEEQSGSSPRRRPPACTLPSASHTPPRAGPLERGSSGWRATSDPPPRPTTSPSASHLLCLCVPPPLPMRPTTSAMVGYSSPPPPTFIPRRRNNNSRKRIALSPWPARSGD